MRRFLVGISATCAAIVAMMPSAAATRPHGWSEPENLGSMINSGFEDTGPAISKDGRVLYFQSTRPREDGSSHCTDIWVAERQSVHHGWDTPQNLGPLVNTSACENSAGLSRNEHHLYFSRPPGDIWVAYRKDVRDPLGWELPVRLGPTINTETSAESTARHFASTKHGISQLYFFSNRPGGMGEADIYFADLFGALPQPVGELNSPQTDGGAVLSKNGLEIFFHSTRPGVGVRDLWTATRNSVYEAWSAPSNLTDVNSTAEDLFPALSGEDNMLFFASTRPGGFGLGDIYVTTRGKH